MMLDRGELILVAKILVGVGYLALLYLAPQVLQETFTVFDYGRF